MFERTCKLPKNHSFFLFGARGSGKTSLIRSQVKQTPLLWIDLLDRKVEDRYLTDPGLLYQECQAGGFQWVVIDEVQKAPLLLDAVHRVIESVEFSPPKFALTGSSARKLRHGAANLLAGRAFVRNLYPLTHRECGDSFDLEQVLNFGTLPKMFGLTDDEERHDFLTSYGLTYLNEEVWAEHLIQDLEPFRKFLEVAAQTNGQIINYAKIGRDVRAHEKTVKKYFQILEDTLLGFLLEPYHRSIRKRQLQSPKFFLFDLGVKRALERSLRQRVIPQTYAFGRAFEHLVLVELIRLNDYGRKDFRFSHFLTKDEDEIDLIIERPGLPLALVEIKAATKTTADDTRYMRSIIPDIGPCDAYCLSLDPHERVQDGIHYLPWIKGLAALGV